MWKITVIYICSHYSYQTQDSFHIQVYFNVIRVYDKRFGRKHIMNIIICKFVNVESF